MKNNPNNFIMLQMRVLTELCSENDSEPIFVEKFSGITETRFRYYSKSTTMWSCKLLYEEKAKLNQGEIDYSLSRLLFY